MDGGQAQHGQAAAELVALLPCVAALLAVAWQLVLAGHAAWAAQAAARAGARAAAVGADPAVAARRHLAPPLERGLRVRRHDGGAVEVRVRIPAAIPPLRLGTIGARAHFEPQAAR